MERRRFTREFKIEAVRLIRDRGVSYAQASEDLKVHPTPLRSWVKALAADPEQALASLFWLQGRYPADSAASDGSISQHPGSGGRGCYHC